MKGCCLSLCLGSVSLCLGSVSVSFSLCLFLSLTLSLTLSVSVSLSLSAQPMMMPINIDLLFGIFGTLFYGYGVYLHWGYESPYLSAHNPIFNTRLELLSVRLCCFAGGDVEDMT